MMKLSTSIARLILALLLLGIALPVHADVSPPPFPSASGIYPNKGGTTQVRMMAETVELTIIPDATKEFPDGFASVKAIFHMLNTGAELEKMDVYFPLDLGNCQEDAKQMRLYVFQSHPPIRDFRVTVAGSEQPTTTMFQRVRGELSTDPLETDVACWVYFPTLFPVGKDVTIEVSYKAPASANYSDINPEIGFSYILHTGAGWSDTIGSADITVHMPYPIMPENLTGYQPKEGKSQGRDITWHFENFEPDYNWDIYISMLKPAIWRAIQAEQKNTKANPRDAEAWGRLGKAYKEAILEVRGMRDDEAGLQMYQASVAAYSKAIALKPKDADWHAGYAELLCNKSVWDSDLPVHERFTPCVEEIKKALDLNPQQAKAKKLLEGWAGFEFHAGMNDNIIDVSGPQPDYLILTPEPNTATPQPTATAVPTASATPTLAPTLTQTATAQPTPTATPTRAATDTRIPPTQTPARASSSGLCGSAILPAVMIGLLLIWKNRLK